MPPRKLALVLAICALAAPTFAGLRVDLSQDNGRGDVLAPGWEQWRVPEGTLASAKFGEVTVILRASGATLATRWWKPGFDYPARMASDGVVVAGTLELVFSGLPDGKHSLGTYHNGLADTPPDRITIAVQELGQAASLPRAEGSQAGSLRQDQTAVRASANVVPTNRVKHDADVGTAFVEFTAKDGKDVVVILTPEDGASVVLNGFEIDRPDPARRATKPTPFEDDEHAPEDPVLAWQAAHGATMHQVYLGTDPIAVSGATRESPLYCGETKEASFPTAQQKLDNRQPYFWRVDTVHDSSVVRGEVWRFRVRHLAFPEAEGYGRFSIGGRSGKIYEVTNLDDHGAGSLREGVEASGPRTIVFRVGGVIPLKSKLIVRNPYLTVAGQTAPGDGICVTNYTFGCLDAHDVIMRHIRIRVGDASGQTQDGCGARSSDHCIFDHCSISWSIDEGFSSREAHNITFQRCIIAEALNIANHKKYEPGKGHSFAASISGDIGSYHHNLLANCTGRNWSLAGGLDRAGERLAGRLDIRNNVVYNWSHRTTDGGVRELNFVNNCYLPGPATKVFTLLRPDPGDPDRGMRAHMIGNVIVDRAEFDSDNWKAYGGPDDGMAKMKADELLFEPFVRTHSAKDALQSVLADVAATRPKQDAVDQRIIREVRARRHTYTGSKGLLPGIIDSPQDAGGLPEYMSATPPTDTDHDGMPDDWERACGLDPANPADGATFRVDGYTNLEHYLNELVMYQP